MLDPPNEEKQAAGPSGLQLGLTNLLGSKIILLLNEVISKLKVDPSSIPVKPMQYLSNEGPEEKHTYLY